MGMDGSFGHRIQSKKKKILGNEFGQLNGPEFHVKLHGPTGNYLYRVTSSGTCSASTEVLFPIPISLQVQPSPTTGKIPFAPSSNSRGSTLITESSDKSRSFFEDIGSSSFAFKPIAESSPSLFFGATSNVSMIQKFHSTFYP